MTRTEADQIVVYLSITYGPWSDLKMAMYADDIIDLPYNQATQAAHEWVRGNPGNKWPGPGDIRYLTSRIMERRPQLRLVDDRASGKPIERDAGLKFLKEMRERLESRERVRLDEPAKLADVIGKVRIVPAKTEDQVEDVDF